LETRSNVATSVLSLTLSRRRVVAVAGVLAFTAATAAAAHVRIPLPFSPVPVTMQTLVVLLAGATLGARGGAISQALYLALGAAGLPVFAAAPVTNGYLVGFVIAALIVGAVAGRTSKALWVGLAMAAGSLIILVLGASWLALICGMSARQAVAVGLLPYLIGDALKLAAALGMWRPARGVWHHLVTGGDAG